MILANPPQGLNDALVKAANNYFMAGKTGYAQDVIRVRRKTFWHRQVLGNAGATSLEFYASATASKFVCNLSNGRISNDQLFLMQSFSIDVFSGVTIAGAAVAAGASAGGAATYTVPQVWYEQVKNIIKSGLVTVNVSNVQILDEFGIDALPAGGGLSADFGLSNIDSDLGVGRQDVFVNMTNGAPHADNVCRIPMYPLTPGVELRAGIEWAAAIDPVDDAGINLVFKTRGTLFELAYR